MADQDTDEQPTTPNIEYEKKQTNERTNERTNEQTNKQRHERAVKQVSKQNQTGQASNPTNKTNEPAILAVGWVIYLSPGEGFRGGGSRRGGGRCPYRYGHPAVRTWGHGATGRLRHQRNEQVRDITPT